RRSPLLSLAGADSSQLRCCRCPAAALTFSAESSSTRGYPEKRFSKSPCRRSKTSDCQLKPSQHCRRVLRETDWARRGQSANGRHWSDRQSLRRRTRPPCFAVSGPTLNPDASRTLEAGSAERVANMRAFAAAALQLCFEQGKQQLTSWVGSGYGCGV